MKSKKAVIQFGLVLVLLLMLSGCSAPKAENAVPTKQDPSSQATAIVQELSVGFPLSQNGDYAVAIRRNITYTDDRRAGREVSLTIWYPTLPADSGSGSENKDAPPDMSGAPYPLLLSSSKLGFIFASSLVSHGFVYAGVNGIDTYKIYDQNMIDQPLDMLFALSMLADDPPEWLAGLADTDMAGMLGYSFDGYNSLAVSGVRMDPQAYLAHCAELDSAQPPPEDWYLEYLCTVAKNWDEFEAHAGKEITESADGLWQPMTDARIKAVMPMGPDGRWLFNERGLAAADRPVFIINAEQEEFYLDEAAYIFEHLGSKDKYLVTFLERAHMMIYDAPSVTQMMHFANAFFGYYLQGREDYAQFYSKEFVDQHDDLAWGIYRGD